MRAVTLSDEAVTTLVNRRFVFTYFSLVDWADLSDAEAKQAIVRVAPEYGAKVRQTPPTFFFSPDGEVLATLDTLASSREFLELAKRLLAEHPEYARPSPDEADLWKSATADPRSRLRLARLQLELVEVDGAKRTLETLVGPGESIEDAVRAGALYLLTERARIEGDAPRAARYLAEIDALPSAARAGLELDLRMERAHLLALGGDWNGSLRAWSEIEADHQLADRMDELLYWKGLSYYHLGKRREANYTWVRVLKEIPEGRYYQRARLAAMGPAQHALSGSLVSRKGAGAALALAGRRPERSARRQPRLRYVLERSRGYRRDAGAVPASRLSRLRRRSSPPREVALVAHFGPAPSGAADARALRHRARALGRHQRRLSRSSW